MNEKKNYKEPETEIELLNAQLRISRWFTRKFKEYQDKLDKLEEKKPAEKAAS